MATYKLPCIHCGHLLDEAAKLCSNCASSSPFGYACPACKNPVVLTDAICSDCGRGLYIGCPYCQGRTFAQPHCQLCGRPLTVGCTNKRCSAPQFFENKRCTACGKKIKAKLAANPKER
ncbi:MAG: zinc ribbon domain-containing protein [Propionibacteriaceae bacterium]|nr:zinc ribbon domain-containing protein [Propionibacteriaceae bacterium]